MEHRERHCPGPSPRCLIPLLIGYIVPVPWPKSSDMICYDNVPHPELVEYRKGQHWAVKLGEYLNFPGGGTQFKDGVDQYIHFIQKGPLDADGGKPLLELNRILRPGGYFIRSATPVYRDDERDKNVGMVVKKTSDSSGVGLVICQKATSTSCFEECSENHLPICDKKNKKNNSWYLPLFSLDRYLPLTRCISQLSVDSGGHYYNWPAPWPQRLTSKPPSLSVEPSAEEKFMEDTKHWSTLVSDVYRDNIGINWSSVRNVLDMNAGYGGFAAALIDLPLWVMNVVPIDLRDTLSIIFDRGLFGLYHDWCESFNTYPRTYDLLHSSFLFTSLKGRCGVVAMVVEMDRILRPGGYVLIHDNIEVIKVLGPIFNSLH